MDEDNSLRDRDRRTSRNNHFNILNPEETTTFGRASRHSPNIPEDYHIKFEQVTGGTILNLVCLTNREEMLNTWIKLMDLNIQTKHLTRKKRYQMTSETKEKELEVSF